MSELVATWKDIQVSYELLWEFDDSLVEDESLKEYKENKRREAQLDETKLPKSKKLIQASYDRVWSKRGTHV
jgi:hypothetical protein